MRSFLIFILLLPSLGIACNIDSPDDPSNKPDCYKEPLKTITKGERLHGWPKGLELKEKPEASAKTLATFNESAHWSDEEIELTGKTQGEWVEVIYFKMKSKKTDCESTPEVSTKTPGWIKGLDSKKKPLLWKWLFNGLC